MFGCLEGLALGGNVESVPPTRRLEEAVQREVFPEASTTSTRDELHALTTLLEV